MGKNQQSVANQLALLFGWLGFAIVACTMSPKQKHTYYDFP